MKKKGLIISAIVIVALVAGGLGYRAWASSQNTDQSEAQTTTVSRGSLKSTLSSSGNTRTGQSATIAWETSGKVGEITLEPGDVVSEDQVLAILDQNTLSNEMINAKQDLITAQQTLDDLMNSKVQQAQALQAVEDAQKALDSLKQTAAEESSQAQLALANAQDALEDAQRTRNAMNYPHSSDELTLEKAETDYLLAKADYKEALSEYHKYKSKKLTHPERVRALNMLITARQKMNSTFATYNWYLQNYSDIEIAQADAELAVAQANLEVAQAEWERAKDGTSDAAVALAEATLADAQREWERVKDGPNAEDIAAAQAAVDAAQALLDNAELLAPFSGTITEVDLKTGDLVNLGETAFRIDDLAAIYIDLQISEIDLASLEVGQQAVVEFDAIADKEYSGEVTEIGMIGSVSQGVVNYPVTVRVTDADEDILPGMTASITIIVDQVEDALLAPNKAIRTSGGEQYVTVMFEGQQINVPVTVGLVGDTMSEVISDQLMEGDAVVVNGSTRQRLLPRTSPETECLLWKEWAGRLLACPKPLPKIAKLRIHKIGENMKTTLIILGTVVLVVLIAAGSFYGGMMYQSNQSSQVRQEFMAARGMSNEGQMPGDMPLEAGQFQQGGTGFPGRGAAGQVKSIDGNVMTISTAQDVTTVNLSEDTQIEMTVSGEIADLQAGMRVMVVGETDDDGVIDASQISILSENQTGMPFGQQPPNSPDSVTEP